MDWTGLLDRTTELTFDPKFSNIVVHRRRERVKKTKSVHVTHKSYTHD